jgi:hypothetical protein
MAPRRGAHPDLEAAAALVAELADGDTDVVESAASIYHIDPDELWDHLCHTDPRLAATLPGLSAERQHRLYTHADTSGDVSIHRSLSTNPSAAPSVLDLLARSRDRRRSWRHTTVLNHPNCPARLLELAARDRNVQIVIQAARNPATPGTVVDAIRSRDFDDGPQAAAVAAALAAR